MIRAGTCIGARLQSVLEVPTSYVLDAAGTSAAGAQLSTHVRTPYLRTHTGGSAHVPKRIGLCESAHVKSLYEARIVGRIMNTSHLFSYPAPYAQLWATVTRTMPSIDPSIAVSVKSLHVCGAEVSRRHFATAAAARPRTPARYRGIVYSPPTIAIRFISSEKRKGARKTFTFAIYVRCTRGQRYSEDRASVGARPPGDGSLLAPVMMARQTNLWDLSGDKLTGLAHLLKVIRARSGIRIYIRYTTPARMRCDTQVLNWF